MLISLFWKRLVSGLGKCDSLALVYSQSYNINEEGEIIESMVKWTNSFANNIWENDFCIQGKDFLQYLYDKNVIPNASACLLKKDILKEILNSETEIENFRMTGDWFSWLLVANLPVSFNCFCAGASQLFPKCFPVYTKPQFKRKGAKAHIRRSNDF